jgi:VanZ family protein
MHDRHFKILLGDAFRKLSFRSAIVFYALILVGGSLPGAREDIGQFASGLVLHSLAYATLAFLLFAGMRGNEGVRAGKSVMIIALMGAFDEYVQGFFPYRMASLADWLVDVTAGILVSAALWTLWPRHEVSVRAAISTDDS